MLLLLLQLLLHRRPRLAFDGAEHGLKHVVGHVATIARAGRKSWLQELAAADYSDGSCCAMTHLL